MGHQLRWLLCDSSLRRFSLFSRLVCFLNALNNLFSA
nr:MAG TPA: hypothetical protein [Bacteriophage sp.]